MSPAAKTAAKQPETATGDGGGGSLADQYPNTWIPEEPGDSLSGTVREITRAWSDAKNKGTGDGWYPLLKIQRDDDGALKDFHAFMTVSFNQVMELQPVPGEHVVVTFQGLGKAKPNQSAPKIFHLRVDGRDPVAAANAVYGRIGDGYVANKPSDTPTSAHQGGAGNGGDDPGEFEF